MCSVHTCSACIVHGTKVRPTGGFGTCARFVVHRLVEARVTLRLPPAYVQPHGERDLALARHTRESLSAGRSRHSMTYVRCRWGLRPQPCRVTQQPLRLNSFVREAGRLRPSLRAGRGVTFLFRKSCVSRVLGYVHTGHPLFSDTLASSPAMPLLRWNHKKTRPLVFPSFALRTLPLPPPPQNSRNLARCCRGY